VKSSKVKRDEILSVRLTPLEAKSLDETARKFGLDRSKLVRKFITQLQSGAVKI